MTPVSSSPGTYSSPPRTLCISIVALSGQSFALTIANSWGVRRIETHSLSSLSLSLFSLSLSSLFRSPLSLLSLFHVSSLAPHTLNEEISELPGPAPPRVLSCSLAWVSDTTASSSCTTATASYTSQATKSPGGTSATTFCCPEASCTSQIQRPHPHIRQPQPHTRVRTPSCLVALVPEPPRMLSYRETEFLIDNLLVRIHISIVMILVDRPCAIGI